MIPWDLPRIQELLTHLEQFCRLFWEPLADESQAAERAGWLTRQFDHGLFDLTTRLEWDDTADSLIAYVLDDQNEPRVKFARRVADSYSGIVADRVSQYIEELYQACDWEPGDRDLDELVLENWGKVFRRLKTKILKPAMFQELQRRVKEEHRQRTKVLNKRNCRVYRAKKPLVTAGVEKALAHYRLAGRGGNLAPSAARPAQRKQQYTDAVRFLPGEPAQRFVTKVGGLPYRPADLAWPRAAYRTPLTFLAQFCFRDSQDLVGRLPGDVLLLFAADEDEVVGDGDLWYEWYPLGLADLIPPEKVPQTAWQIAPCYGLLQRLPERGLGQEGTKIGGEPHWIQNDPDPRHPFLATLGQVTILKKRPKGWEATRAAPQPPTREGQKPLSLGDAGLLNLFLAGKTRIEAVFQCY
jgi:hypothetical protein